MLILSYYCLDDPLLKLLEQAEDAVRGDRGDTQEGKPCEHVAQKAGADAAVVVAASKVKSRAGNQGQHEDLGDAGLLKIGQPKVVGFPPFLLRFSARSRP